ncbi:hypothetical protein DTO280E4_5529 [Paecilomyces variotii]|nr:hypothetical protein DTO280E4_5529 [Paecilomyces variotii]
MRPVSLSIEYDILIENLAGFLFIRLSSLYCTQSTSRCYDHSRKAVRKALHLRFSGDSGSWFAVRDHRVIADKTAVSE